MRGLFGDQEQGYTKAKGVIYASYSRGRVSGRVGGGVEIEIERMQERARERLQETSTMVPITAKVVLMSSARREVDDVRKVRGCERIETLVEREDGISRGTYFE